MLDNEVGDYSPRNRAVDDRHEVDNAHGVDDARGVDNPHGMFGDIRFDLTQLTSSNSTYRDVKKTTSNMAFDSATTVLAKPYTGWIQSAIIGNR